MVRSKVEEQAPKAVYRSRTPAFFLARSVYISSLKLSLVAEFSSTAVEVDLVACLPRTKRSFECHDSVVRGFGDTA